MEEWQEVVYLVTKWLKDETIPADRRFLHAVYDSAGKAFTIAEEEFYRPEISAVAVYSFLLNDPWSMTTILELP